jgi:hypothetical protein
MGVLGRRPGIGLWVQDARRAGALDPQGWRYHNLAREHNALVAEKSLQFGAENAFFTPFHNTKTAFFCLPRQARDKHKAKQPLKKEVFSAGAPELAIKNASSATSDPVMTKAYTGLETTGCEGQSCKLTVSYDRVCNGNAGPPGPHGDKDWAFTMDIIVNAS